MNLIELIVASLLLAGTATSGLHLWGQASLAAHLGCLKEEQLESVELQLLASQRWLSAVGHGSELLTAKGSCRFDLGAVSRSVDRALPLPEGLERHWQAYGAGLWLEIDAIRLTARLLSRFDVVSCLRPRVLVGAGPL